MAEGRRSKESSASVSHSRDRDGERSNCTIGRSEDAHTYSLLNHVFNKTSQLSSEAGASSLQKPPTLQNLETFIEKSLEDSIEGTADCEEPMSESCHYGKIGGLEVMFDILSNVGTLIVEPDRLGLSSLSNFSTMRANCCVFKGKWIYELWLGSKGVMQLGWCTLNCKFSQEEGVGDTADSYAYDGSRLRKWNVKTQRYGEQWLTGDVISCAMDCDNGTVTFYSCTYPIEGYKPLQDPCVNELAKAKVLFSYLEKLLPVLIEDEKVISLNVIGGKPEEILPPLTENRGHRCTGLLLASHIYEHLGPLLKSAYVIEACLLKYISEIVDYNNLHSDQPYVCQLLDLSWTLLQDFEIKSFMENLVICLLSAYRFSPVTSDFTHADEEIPPEEKNSPEELEKKKKYFASCEKLRTKIEEIEEIQVEILKILLIHNDLNEKNETTRVIFLEKFRSFLRENSGVSRVQQVHSCPLAVNLCFYHRLVQAVRYYWDKFRQEDPNRFVHSKDAFMPVQEFWSDSREYFDFQRCGGLMSHLNRILGGEVNKAQGLVVYDDGKDIKVKSVEPSQEYPDTELPSGNSLIDLLDGLVILYHSAAHKQLGKMVALRDNMRDFILALQDTQEKYDKCPEEMCEVKEDLLKAKEVFLEKITEQARHMGWVISVIYSRVQTFIFDLDYRLTLFVVFNVFDAIIQSKQEDVCWILNVVLKTVEKASRYRRLLQFMPEFYIETCVNAYNALKNFIHPTTPFESLDGHEDLLRRYATFLTNHFADSKIVSNDLRDSLVQALACFTCYPNTLHILETLPMQNRETMIRALIAPYENRSWAHTNWILVRLWKGCGFGFRYRYLPNLVPSKVQPTEFSFVSLQKPCPSQILQSLLAKILLDDEPTATRFLDTLMNQLNWSFSEFVGIMQEIQILVSRTEHLYIESRQLKICAACFEISVCLLRVLEMVVTIAPDLFTDYCRSSAELFLKRIMQLLSQVLSRITTKNGAFENLSPLPIPGLDSVTYYPILTVAVGILVQLIGRSGGTSQERATRALLTDAGFMIKSLEFVFDEERSSKFSKPFSFKRFEEISSEEIQDVESLIVYLKKHENIMSKQAQEIKEEDLCTICYANIRTAIFVPCNHQSCRTCITQQLMNKKECFFCKSIITSVTDTKNRPILREHFMTSKKSS
ncbi:hypothetical protein LOTGIDRAFT_234381 [Lottia gigantea]|uniref:RING-type E3 ubiquitin transferase n=1 Tax=Lottia gigantea TaxID=225164 RepID=V4A671_LOTGI|nr:hypothetical protein LOTGIDRAFT_234381 [Lottia gigantea]ESO88781.1 hypothetical protein LOTGIDRAFT_234381 [Lottia gigantea]